MRKIKVSVIMPFFNESVFLLEKSIKSILNQSFRDFEFIIVLDNPKNLKGRKLVLDFIKKDKRIVFIENKVNCGLPYSLNKAIKIAKGDFIARHDGDDFCLENRLELQYNFMKKNLDCDLLFLGTNYINEAGEILKVVCPNKDKVNKREKYFFKEQLFVHPTLFARREVFDKNMYDNKFKKAQDFELWLRLLKKYKFYVLDDLVYFYRIKTILKNKTKNQIKLDNNFLKLKFGILAMHKNFFLYKFNPYFYIKLFRFYFLLIVFLLISFFENGRAKNN